MKDSVRGISDGRTYPTVHRTALSLDGSEGFDKETMRSFDEQYLTPVVSLGPEDIKCLRNKAGVSQAVLARILNVTASTVFQWERGDKRPTGSALKLLALMQSKSIDALL